MPDFPNDIWIRDPIIDGVTSLDTALGLMQEARDEIEEIQTKLGTNVAGLVTDLATRFAVRLSPSGIRRGQMYLSRIPNTDPTVPEAIKGWGQGESTLFRFGSVTGQAGTRPTVLFTPNYTTAPIYVICQVMSPDITPTNVSIFTTQVIYDTITTASFQVEVRQKQLGGTDQINPIPQYGLFWCAFGGT